MGQSSSTLEEVVKKTVLITGGLGCLGGRLCEYLQNTGFKVVVGSSRESAKLPKSLSKCSLSLIDLNDIESLKSICDHVNYVVHLATINRQLSQKNPQLAVKINGIGTLNLIQASISSHVEYFLYFSTVHVYGSPLIGQISEHTLPRPVHPYAISHRLAEDFLLESISSNNIKGDIIRLSNTVGLPLLKAADCWTLFVNDICKQAIVEQRITINSHSNSERDFIAILSVCEVVEYFLDNKPHSDFSVYNVGSGYSSSLLEIAKLVAERCEVLYGYSPELIYSNRDNQPKVSLKYQVDKLTSEMKYKLSGDLIPSIDDILRFCKSEFD